MNSTVGDDQKQNLGQRSQKHPAFQTADDNGQTGGGAGFDKEHGPVGRLDEVVSVMEVESFPEVPLEVREYVEKVDKQNLELDKPIVYGGQSVLEPATSKALPKIQLPLNRSGILNGLKQRVDTGIRWLSTWCVMIIKKFGGRVIYSKQPDNNEVE